MKEGRYQSAAKTLLINGKNILRIPGRNGVPCTSKNDKRSDKWTLIHGPRLRGEGVPAMNATNPIVNLHRAIHKPKGKGNEITTTPMGNVP